MVFFLILMFFQLVENSSWSHYCIFVTLLCVQYFKCLCFQIEKFGDPNGIVRFDGLAQVEQTFDEPENGMRTVLFPVIRSEGIQGEIQVNIR